MAVNAWSSAASAIYIIGNEIHDIADIAIGGMPDAGAAAVRVVNNTILNAVTGIEMGEARSNIVRASGVAIASDVSGCSHNLVQSGAIRVSCTNGRSGDPRLLMSGPHVVGLQPDSPALDAGLANHAAYGTFATRFGTSIAFDRVGTARPQGAGWDIGAYERSAVPAADVVFKDGFETGTLTAWSSTGSGISGLVVTEDAAMAGTDQGVAGVVKDTTSLYVQDDTPADGPRYRARFYVDPTGFDPGVALNHFRSRIFVAWADASGRRVAAVVLRKRFGQFALLARTRDDAKREWETNAFAISAGPHAVELDLAAASGPAAADGTFTLWIDGVEKQSLRGLQNASAVVGYVRMGALSLKAGAAGTIRFDEFESRRTSYIGPLP
jgi:hypothetical protein